MWWYFRVDVELTAYSHHAWESIVVKLDVCLLVSERILCFDDACSSYC